MDLTTVRSTLRRQSSAAKDKNAKCDSRAPTSGDRWKDDGTSGTAQSEEKESRRSRKARARAEQKAEKKLHPSPQEILSGASDDSTVFRLNRESDTGPVEHKWRLKRPAPVRFQQLVLSLMTPYAPQSLCKSMLAMMPKTTAIFERRN
jgi:hypothetical protein